jgi:hypothetical protein
MRTGNVSWAKWQREAYKQNEQTINNKEAMPVGQPQQLKPAVVMDDPGRQ